MPGDGRETDMDAAEVERAGRAGPPIVAALLALTLGACADDPGPTGPLPGLPPTVLGVEPSVVEAGGSATVRGLNFPADPSAVEVEVADRSASVTSASETSLGIQLPAPSSMPCRPTRRVQLRVASGGGGDSASHRLSVAPAVSLAPGESRALLAEEDRIECREFPAADAEYLVSVFNASESPSTTVGFEVRGTAGAGEREDSTASASVADRGGIRGEGVDRPRLPSPLREAVAAREAHAELMRATRGPIERARRSPGGLGLEDIGPSGEEVRASGGEPGVSPQQAPPDVGEHVQFRVPDVDQSSGFCDDYIQVTGRVAHVTEHAVLVSDTANPIDGQYDDRLREMGSEFESRMWPVIRDNFGDPLRLDGQLNDDGRLYMLFTPEVNEFSGGVLAFVFGGDFFPRQSDDPDQPACAASDTAEVFYSRAPSRVAPDDYELDATGGWQWVIRSTLAHEVKHLASNAERIARGLPVETPWLEEATAHVAEELYAREVFGLSQGANATYDRTLYCAVRPTVAECEGTPFVMFNEFLWLAQYMQFATSLSSVDANRGDAVFRGSGWWLLRWAVDHAPVPEDEFLRAMTTAADTGIANLEARAGRGWAGILSDWTLSLATDDSPAGEMERQELAVPSWDLRDIYAGLNEDFGTRPFDSPYPLAVRSEEYGSFTAGVGGLPGGSAAILRLIGRPGISQLVEIAPLGGGTLPPELRVSVVRLP